MKTLITWFPDRPGIATGMTIMGFGGGAFIVSSMRVALMKHFSTDTHIGMAETFLCQGVGDFLMMIIGAYLVRVPVKGWTPERSTSPVTQSAMITR